MLAICVSEWIKVEHTPLQDSFARLLHSAGFWPLPTVGCLLAVFAYDCAL